MTYGLFEPLPAPEPTVPAAVPLPPQETAIDALGLRPYQHAGLDAVMGSFDAGVRRTLMTAATGTGKTVTFSHIVKRFTELYPEKKVLIIAHRAELMDQAARKIRTITGIRCHVEKADQFAGRHAKVIIASIQTLISVSKHTKNRRVEDRFKPTDFSLVVLDETHRYISPQWVRVPMWLSENNPELCILGVTATPKRGDDKAMGKLFESVAHQYPIHQGIEDGWIVPVRQTTVTVDDLDLSKVRTTAGDLNEGELAEILEFEKNLHGMATPVLKLANGRQTLVFCVTVAHAERFAEILNRHKPGCAQMVCGKTPEEERKELFAAYGSGKFQILCNVGIVTEGTDLPGVEVIAMARPTKSAALFEQMIGRGIRPADEIAEHLNTLASAEHRCACIAASRKAFCEIIDFVGNCGKHKLIQVADVLGGDYSDAAKERAKQKAKAAGAPADIMALLKTSAEEIIMERERKRLNEEAEKERRKGIIAQSQYRTGSVDLFDYYNIKPPRLTNWDGLPRATPTQIECFRRRGFEIDWSRLTKGEAGRIISQSITKPTMGQMRVLTRAGYRPDELKEISISDASKIIDRVKANGWKRVNIQRSQETAS